MRIAGEEGPEAKPSLRSRKTSGNAEGNRIGTPFHGSRTSKSAALLVNTPARVHLADVVAASAAERGFRRLGLTETPLADRQRGLSAKAERAQTGLHAPRPRRTRGDESRHRGRAGVRCLRARSGGNVSACDGAYAGRRLRRGGAGLYRNSAEHERRALSTANTGLNATAGTGGYGPRRAPGGASTTRCVRP